MEVIFLRKGVAAYAKYPIYFIYNGPLIAPDEIFVDLPTWQVPGIYDYYMISNYGRVYNKYKNTLLKIQTGTDGYLQINLSGSFGNKLLRINRLVMMAFYPIENPDLYVVNHLDGNPLNNHVTNLEWTSRSGNIIHAYNHGLMKKGEDGPTAKITNETAHEICKLLKDGWKYQDVYEKLKDKNVTYGIVQNIGRGRDWVDISSIYGIGPRRNQKRFSTKEVDKLCKYFENNPMTDNEYDYFETAIILCNIEENVSHDLMINSVSRLYNRETYTKQTSKYNF